MRIILKKYRIVFTVLALLIMITSVPSLFLYLNSIKVSYGFFPFDKNKEKLFLNDSLLWDTGATGSTIYEEHKDKIHNKIQFGYHLGFDTFYKMRFHKLYYLSQFDIGDTLTIHNFSFKIIENILPEEIKQSGEIGIIGMDVISKANWIIDFDLGKIDIISKNKTYKTKDQPQLVFKYKHTKKPKTQLDFSVCQVGKILIDAGFNGELSLLRSDIEKINGKYKPIDTLEMSVYGLYSISPIIQNCYVYDIVKINNIYFRNIQICESDNRLIGFKFFKRFNKVFLNTKEKEFCFY